MFVKVFKLGEEEEVTTFPIGTHVLGRGPSLQCNDKRVSRNHATLEVTEDNVNLTSTHVNPCFLKASDSKTITILTKDSTSQLNDGDSFALLPEDFWFKIKLASKEETKNEDETNVEKVEERNKRFSHSVLEDAPPDKKPKLDLNENNDASEVPTSSADGNGEHNMITEQENLVTTESASDDVLGSNEISHPETTNDLEASNAPIKEENDEIQNQENTGHLETDNIDAPETSNTEATGGPIKEEINETENQENAVSSTNVSQNDDSPNAENVKEEEKVASPSGGGTDSNPSPPQPKTRREKCWYGAECYRKNPVHRQDFTHPGDSDFESDPDDNRPSCSYGARCFRKNKDHRQQYKHPPRERPGKKKRDRKKVKRLNAANTQEMTAFYDEFSDNEDPFINDDDSDEYTGESDDDDWGDSSDTGEDDV